MHSDHFAAGVVYFDNEIGRLAGKAILSPEKEEEQQTNFGPVVVNTRTAIVQTEDTGADLLVIENPQRGAEVTDSATERCYVVVGKPAFLPGRLALLKLEAIDRAELTAGRPETVRV